MNSIEDLLDEMDALVDKSKGIPLVKGKALIDVEQLRSIIDDIRLNLPVEIRKARGIVGEHSEILSEARKDAESITRKAEERARQLVSQEEVVRRATIQANETITQSQTKAREIRKTATDYAENVMRKTEEIISEKLGELRRARSNLQSAVAAESQPQTKPKSD